MDLSLFDIFLLFLLIYAVGPTILVRFGQIGAISRAPKGHGRIALTFDDGPDPRYTPQILDILGRYQVKATFFVIGKRARDYPDLIKQIVSAGHEIGNHGFGHKPAWLLSPRATTREITETSLTIEELTGKKTRFCRPAWGLFNLISIWYCWLKGQKVVLWTYMSWDWIKKATPESITNKVLGRIRDGVILVFHDSDWTPGAAAGGPARVVAALPGILEGLKQRGLRVAPLEEITHKRQSGKHLKKVMIWFWGHIEKVIRKVAGFREAGTGPGSFYRVALRRHRGRDWLLQNGVTLCRGDAYVELHVNNERLMSLVNENTTTERMALIALREARNGLTAVAGFIDDNPGYREAKALLGITLLHRGTERIGFKAYDLQPGLFRLAAGIYERWLLGLFHPGGFKKLREYRDKLEPKYVVMTRQELMSRYAPGKDLMIE